MDDGQRMEFRKLLGAVMELYGAKITRDATALWWSALALYELDAIRVAFSAHVQDAAAGRFPAKPSDIIGRLQALGPPPGAVQSSAAFRRPNESQHDAEVRQWLAEKKLAGSRDEALGMLRGMMRNVRATGRIRAQREPGDDEAEA